MSAKICDPRLEVFEPPVECSDIVSSVSTVNYDITGEQFASALTNYSFTLNDQSAFYNLEEMVLEVALDGDVTNGTPAVVALATANAAAGHVDAVQFNNGFGMFERAHLFLNDTLVEERYDCGNESMMMLHTQPRMADDEAVLQAGMMIGANRTQALLAPHSERRHLLLPLKMLFSTLENFKITRGVTVKIQLQPNTVPAQWIWGATTTVSNVYASRMRLFVPQVKLSLSALAAYEAKLASGAVSKRVSAQIHRYHSATTPAATLSRSFNVASTTNKVTRVFVVATLDAQTYATDAYDWAACNVRSVKLRINSSTYPRELIETNYTVDAEDYFAEYKKWTDIHGSDSTAANESPISYAEFATHARIYAFDINDDEVLSEGSRINDITCEIQLRAAAPAAWRGLVFVESEHEMEWAAQDGRIVITKK